MDDKNNDRIIITRLSERGISVDCHATKETIARSIIALFKELNNIDSYGSLLLLNGLIDLAADKKEM